MKLRYCDGASFAGDAKFDNGVSPLLVLLLSIKFMGSNILCVRGEKKESTCVEAEMFVAISCSCLNFCLPSPVPQRSESFMREYATKMYIPRCQRLKLLVKLYERVFYRAHPHSIAKSILKWDFSAIFHNIH